MKDSEREENIEEMVEEVYQITRQMDSYRINYEDLHPGFDELDAHFRNRDVHVEIADDSYLNLCNNGEMDPNTPLELYTPVTETNLSDIETDIQLHFGRVYDQTVPVEVIGHSYENLEISVPTFNSFRREAARVLDSLKEEHNSKTN